eukprot:UN25783
MRPTRIDFVWALPAILGLYNHSERVQGTNPQRTFFVSFPIQPEKFFKNSKIFIFAKSPQK